MRIISSFHNPKEENLHFILVRKASDSSLHLSVHRRLLRKRALDHSSVAALAPSDGARFEMSSPQGRSVFGDGKCYRVRLMLWWMFCTDAKPLRVFSCLLNCTSNLLCYDLDLVDIQHSCFYAVHLYHVNAETALAC